MTSSAPGDVQSQANSLITRALDALKRNSVSEAYTHLVEAKNLNIVVRDLELVHGICLIQMNRQAEGLDALRRETVNFPENVQAQQLLQGIIQDQAKQSAPQIPLPIHFFTIVL